MHRVLAKNVTEKVCYSCTCNGKFARKLSMNPIRFFFFKNDGHMITQGIAGIFLEIRRVFFKSSGSTRLPLLHVENRGKHALRF